MLFVDDLHGPAIAELDDVDALLQGGAPGAIGGIDGCHGSLSVIHCGAYAHHIIITDVDAEGGGAVALHLEICTEGVAVELVVAPNPLNPILALLFVV